MNASNDSLLTCYKGWATYQRMLSQVVAALSTDQLDLSSSPTHWTIGQTLQHIVANRVWWFQLWMGVGDSALRPYLDWDPSGAMQPARRTPQELVEGLAATWSMIEVALTQWTMADLVESFAPPALLSQEEQAMFSATTRSWIIWHVLEHEIHHGGEISCILGMNGLLGIYGDF